MPQPRPMIADPALTRPNRFGGNVRDPWLLKLDWNENNDPALIALVANVLNDISPAAASRYPSLGPIYTKLADRLNVRPQSILLTAGSDGAIQQVFEAYVGAADMILMTRPTFGMYEVYAQRSGARIGYVDYQSSSVGPFLETDQLIERIRSDQPKAVFLPNPDSPTGTVLPPGALRAAIEAAGDVGALFVVDEAYYPFYSESALD